MALKTFKPRSQGMRFRVASTFEEITEKKPVKSLTRAVRKTAGRNNSGKITVRHHGGGVKRRYRIIDFRRVKDGVEATVSAIAYDPNRSANLALLEYADGTKTYILAPEGLKVGMKVMSGEKAEATVGNCLPLSQIPLGLMVHCVELIPGRGAKLARPRRTRVRTAGRTAFAAAHRVVDRVHRDTAHRRADAHQALAAGLAQLASRTRRPTRSSSSGGSKTCRVLSRRDRTWRIPSSARSRR